MPGCRHGGWCSWGCAREPDELDIELALIRRFVGELAIVLHLVPAPAPVEDTDTPF